MFPEIAAVDMAWQFNQEDAARFHRAKSFLFFCTQPWARPFFFHKPTLYPHNVFYDLFGLMNVSNPAFSSFALNKEKARKMLFPQRLKKCRP